MMEDTCHDQVGALVELRRTPVGCARGSLLLVAVVILAIRSPIVMLLVRLYQNLHLPISFPVWVPIFPL